MLPFIVFCYVYLYTQDNSSAVHGTGGRNWNKSIYNEQFPSHHPHKQGGRAGLPPFVILLGGGGVLADLDYICVCGVFFGCLLFNLWIDISIPALKTAEMRHKGHLSSRMDRRHERQTEQCRHGRTITFLRRSKHTMHSSSDTGGRSGI